MTESIREEYIRNRPEFDRALPKVCANCESTGELHIHHIVPIALGGSNKVTNLVRLCTGCHAKAHGGLSLVEKAAETLTQRASEGRRARGSIPLGYIYVDDRFEVDESVAYIVRFIFSLRYKSEYSTLNIAEILNYMAIDTVRGASKWSHPAIKRILDNPKYFGDYVYQGTNYGKLIPPILDEEVASWKRNFEEKYKRKRLSPKTLNLCGDVPT